MKTCTYSVWAPPSGIDAVHREYNYDLCAEEVFVKHARCENDRIVLPGMQYRILTLTNCDKLRPRTLDRIAELVGQGATVLGAKPTGTPGLDGFPESDHRVRELADRVWGSVDGKAVTENRFGNGRVIFGPHPHEVLKGMGILSDVDDYEGRMSGEVAVHGGPVSLDEAPPFRQRLLLPDDHGA